MSNILFMGDSLTSGENNRKVSYVDYTNLGVLFNLGVSGTTMGEYSIYPVDGYSLLSQIKMNEMFIADADEIYLEYGCNDVSSIIAGNVSYEQVIISLVKALDNIKQLNPNAKIFFLVLSIDKKTLQFYSMYHTAYLNQYFEHTCINCRADKWYETYTRLIYDIDKVVPIIPLFMGQELLDNMDSDNIHPNDNGYQIAAKNLIQYREVMLDEGVSNRN